MVQFVSGLSGSGLDVQALVASLMQVERLPQQRLTTKRADAVSRAGAWGDLVTRVGALQTGASALTRLEDVRRPAVSSSAPGVLTATASGSGTAAPGSLSLRVLSLATAGRLAGSPIADADAPLTSASRTVLATGTGLGLVSVRADGAASAGEHSIEVTQASEAATLVADSPVARSYASPSTTTFTLDDGRVLSTTLQGEYADAEAVRAEVQADLGADVVVDLDEAGGLRVRTATDGAARSLMVAGAGAADLGLVDGDTAFGANGFVSVDGAADQEVVPGSTVALAAGLTVTTGPRLSAGSATAHVLDLEAGLSLNQLASTLNGAGVPATASIVSTAGGSRLILTSSSTGGAAGVSLTSDDPGLPTLSSIQAGRDAVLGLGSLRVTRPTNTVSDLVPGLTLALTKADPDADVTVTVAPDVDGLSAKVKALVDQVNQTASSVATKTRFSIATGTGGPLVGENAARELVTRINRALSDVAGSGDVTGVSALGIRAQRDGTWAFDETAFKAALEKSPDAVAQVLSAAGSAVADVARSAAGPGGTLRSRQDSENAQAEEIQEAVDAWGTRLTATEDRYRRQYSRLEGILGSLRAQSGFLSGQINGLPGSGR